MNSMNMEKERTRELLMTNSEGEKFIADKSSFQLFFFWRACVVILDTDFSTCENK